MIQLFSTPAFSWGAKGHYIIAEIAWNRLSTKAQDEIRKLGLDAAQFIEASIWADKVRPFRPDTRPWHYVNIPLDGQQYVMSRDCSNNDCVVAKITQFANVVSDRTLLSSLRAEALKFLVHFIGDVHQPLHAASDNDRGGNDVWVYIIQKTTRLHSVWDTDVVDPLGANSSDIARALANQITTSDERKWILSSPEDWANESFKLARDYIYVRSRGPNTQTSPVILPATYITDATPIASERLKMAGVRLAYLLDEAFK